MPRYELSKETREFFQNQGRFKAAHLQKSIHCCMHLCHLLTWAISHFNPFHPFISITHEATHSLRILQKECYLRWSCARQENNEALLDLVFSPRDPQVLRLVWASTQSTVETCKVALGRQGWTHWAHKHGIAMDDKTICISLVAFATRQEGSEDQARQALLRACSLSSWNLYSLMTHPTLLSQTYCRKIIMQVEYEETKARFDTLCEKASQIYKVRKVGAECCLCMLPSTPLQSYHLKDIETCTVSTV